MISGNQHLYKYKIPIDIIITLNILAYTRNDDLLFLYKFYILKGKSSMNKSLTNFIFIIHLFYVRFFV